jgi:glycosyltransferase involved in cell wall biosynthesis
LHDPAYQNTKVLVVRENWLGCTGLSAFNALIRAGVQATSITEAEYLPLWASFPMRVVRRALRYTAVKEFNRALLRDVQRYKPDLLLVFKGPIVLADTLRAIGKMGIVRYCFYPDVSFSTHGPYLPDALPCYDWIFTTKSFGPGDLKTLLGISAASYLPHAYDPDVHRPHLPEARDHDQYDCEVSFIGSWSRKKAQILETFIARRPNIKLKIWGDRWQNLARTSSLRPFTVFHGILGPAYAMAISCSKINLAIMHERVGTASSGDLITSRTFHIPACGGLLLHERSRDLLNIFTEDENCICFDDVDELVSKVDALLADDGRRKSIAQRGRESVESAHSWDHRARTILDHYLHSRAAGRR